MGKSKRDAVIRSMGSASLTSLPVRTSSTPDHVRRGPGRKSAVRKSSEYKASEKG